MNTEKFYRLAFPYVLILILDSAAGYILFYGKNLFRSFTESDYNSIPMILTTNFGLIFQVMVMVLLFLDLQKHRIKYYLIPIAGFLFPLLGIVMFLLVMMNKEETQEA
jgi:hypothetical protein